MPRAAHPLRIKRKVDRTPGLNQQQKKALIKARDMQSATAKMPRGRSRSAGRQVRFRAASRPQLRQTTIVNQPPTRPRARTSVNRPRAVTVQAQDVADYLSTGRLGSAPAGRSGDGQAIEKCITSLTAGTLSLTVPAGSSRIFAFNPHTFTPVWYTDPGTNFGTFPACSNETAGVLISDLITSGTYNHSNEACAPYMNFNPTHFYTNDGSDYGANVKWNAAIPIGTAAQLPTGQTPVNPSILYDLQNGATSAPFGFVLAPSGDSTGADEQGNQGMFQSLGGNFDMRIATPWNGITTVTRMDFSANPRAHSPSGQLYTFGSDPTSSIYGRVQPWNNNWVTSEFGMGAVVKRHGNADLGAYMDSNIRSDVITGGSNLSVACIAGDIPAASRASRKGSQLACNPPTIGSFTLSGVQDYTWGPPIIYSPSLQSFVMDGRAGSNWNNNSGMSYGNTAMQAAIPAYCNLAPARSDQAPAFAAAYNTGNTVNEPPPSDNWGSVFGVEGFFDTTKIFVKVKAENADAHITLSFRTAEANAVNNDSAIANLAQPALTVKLASQESYGGHTSMAPTPQAAIMDNVAKVMVKADSSVPGTSALIPYVSSALATTANRLPSGIAPSPLQITAKHAERKTDPVPPHGALAKVASGIKAGVADFMKGFNLSDGVRLVSRHAMQAAAARLRNSGGGSGWFSNFTNMLGMGGSSYQSALPLIEEVAEDDAPLLLMA